MKSHEYQLSLGHVARILALPTVPAVMFAIFLHLGVSLEMLPSPKPALDIDRTILIHQAEASQMDSAAEIVLAGDSSCLMDVSARQLEDQLHRSVRNLGALSYLDLTMHSRLLNNYLSANPGEVQIVVLLMHPNALRRGEPAAYHTDILNQYFEQKDLYFRRGLVGKMNHWLGLNIFRGRIQSRIQPVPLPGSYGERFGFNHNLWDFMDQNNGSAVDPNDFDPATARGSAEYHLSSSLEEASKQFAENLPDRVKLVVGITPIPLSFARNEHADTHRKMLSTWGEWLEADVLLEDLPPVMNDDLFATVTHLNEQGQSEYTRMLAQHMAKKLFVGLQIPSPPR